MIDAAGYLRMSTDDQTTSIEIQQRELLKKFGKKYNIVAWYIDEGKSGSHSVEKRTHFLKLLEDAEKKLFKVVICYDLSRFTRLDAIDSAFAKKILRDNRIRLDTAIEGEIDWTTSTGRIVDSVLTEGQHEYSTKLAKRVCDGKRTSFDKGIPGQVTPYGLARIVTDTSGNSRFIPRTERFQRPKDWKQTFVEGDPKEVEVVKWMFNEFNSRDVSFHRLAVELNDKGVPSPTGKKWSYQVVHDILGNVRYAGGLSFGKNSSGKHYRIVEGETVPAADAVGQMFRLKSGFLTREDSHEGFIEKELFAAVQIKVQRRWRTGKHASRDFSLTGVLYCGHCGKPLYGNEREPGTKHKPGIKYICKGIHRGSECGQWGVREDVVLPFIVKTIVEQIDQKELKTAQVKLPSRRAGDASGLKSQLTKLRSTYETNWKKFMAMPADELANELQDRLKKMMAEIRKLETEIEEKEVPESWKDVMSRRHAILKELKGKLVTVQTAVSGDGRFGTGYTMPRNALRELLHQSDVRVDLWFERASNHRYRIVRGRLRVGDHAAADLTAAHFDDPASLIV